MAVFEGKKSSNDIINNDTMSDDEVVASYVPPRYLFLYKWQWWQIVHSPTVSGNASLRVERYSYGQTT